MNLLQAGFANPVPDSQACFRAVLDAMARPGTLHVACGAGSPPGLDPATAAVLLTLVDADTPLWLSPGFAAAADWIGFHCGAPLVPAGQAGFLLDTVLPAMSEIAAGSDEVPEDGATVILQVGTLGQGRAFMLEGPGLAAPTPFLADLPDGFAAVWAMNHARFPRGFDLVLCAGHQLAALPRSLMIRAG